MSTGQCEASHEWMAEDPSGKPTVIKCGKPARLYSEFLLPWGVYLCDSCYREMKGKEETGDREDH